MKRAAVCAMVAFALIVAACGGDDEGAETSTTGMSGDMANDTMSGVDMNMGDPDAVRADAVPGAELATGAFVLLATRPPGYDDVTGVAFLARHDAGTTVTVELVGLESGVEYIAHLHEGVCEDNGGAHFKFDPNGSDMPPNEIHLMFVGGSGGSGFMTAENHGVVGKNGRSLVVHPLDLLDNKLACADF